jgi:signal transduction histidine kinase
VASSETISLKRISPLPENIDSFFLLLRLSALLAGVLWYFMAPHSAAQGEILVWLLGSYAFYSCVLYAAIFRWPGAIRYFYLTTLAIDLGFVFTLVHYVGYLQQSFFIGFYLIAAIHSFYFGLRIGLLTALLGSLLYTKIYFDLAGWLVIPWPDFLLRITFLFLISLALGLLAEREKGMRAKVEELNRELARKNAILEQSYRHLSIGRLIGEIAEGINSPCGLMALRSEVLMEEAKEQRLPAEFIGGLELINRCSHEVAQIIKSLLNFSKHEGFEKKLLDLNEVVEETLLLTQGEFEERGLRVQKELTPGLPNVLGDSSELKGVLINLISNAMDALPDGGTIGVATRCDFRNGREVICTVTDNGKGIPEEYQERIFNPFFTTKDKTGGIGLGLSTSLSVMKKHNGMITVKSRPGQGSAFSLALPSYQP